MKNNKTLFERMVLESDTPGATLIRFALGDRFPMNINKVLVGDYHPIAYAQTIIKRHLTTAFIEGGLNAKALPKNSPAWVKQLYVYDEAVAAGLVLRLTGLFADNPERFNEEYLLGQLYLLVMTDTAYPTSIAGGLGSFGSIARMLMKHKPGLYHRPEGIFFAKMSQLLSRIDHPNWFMHQRSWQSLWDEPRLLRALRHFLHATAVSFWLTDPQIEELYEVSREDITLYMYDLIPLLEHSSTTAKEVRDFTKRLHYNFADAPTNTTYDMLLKRPFYWSQMYYGECGESIHRFYQLLHNQHAEVTA